jgi:type IV fimbrial biogenesis protein FimT
MRPMRKPLGLTLPQILVALAVVGVMTGFALPALQAFIERNRAAAALNQIIGALQSARYAAVTLRTLVIACPSADASACGAGDGWHLETLIFADRNGDGRRDPNEQALRWIPGLDNDGRIYWRSFRTEAICR